MFLVKWDGEGLGVSGPTSSVTLNKSLNLAEPQISPFQDERNLPLCEGLILLS